MEERIISQGQIAWVHSVKSNIGTGQDFLRVLRFSPDCIITQTLHTYSFICLEDRRLEDLLSQVQETLLLPRKFKKLHNRNMRVTLLVISLCYCLDEMMITKHTLINATVACLSTCI